MFTFVFLKDKTNEFFHRIIIETYRYQSLQGLKTCLGHKTNRSSSSVEIGTQSPL